MKKQPVGDAVRVLRRSGNPKFNRARKSFISADRFSAKTAHYSCERTEQLARAK
jgi:hypothetical protein